MSRSSDIYPDGYKNFRPQPYNLKRQSLPSNYMIKAPTLISEQKLCETRKEINKAHPPRISIQKPGWATNIQSNCISHNGGCCDNRDAVYDNNIESDTFGSVIECNLK